jgi:hypothetical protein
VQVATNTQDWTVCAGFIFDAAPGADTNKLDGGADEHKYVSSVAKAVRACDACAVLEALILRRTGLAGVVL